MNGLAKLIESPFMDVYLFSLHGILCSYPNDNEVPILEHFICIEGDKQKGMRSPNTKFLWIVDKRKRVEFCFKMNAAESAFQ